MKESFVGMKVQEEMKVLRNELEMSVAPMSQLTKRAYLRLCPKKLKKINLVHKGLKKMKISKLHKPFVIKLMIMIFWNSYCGFSN